MDAVEVKKIIDSKLPDIENSIAFFCGENYKELIKEKMASLIYYVFDNTNSNLDKKQELIDIARSFAKDITYELDIDKKIKRELEIELGKLIYEASQSGYSMEKYIKEKSIHIKLLKNNISIYNNKLIELVSLYNNDYQVKDLKAKLKNNQKEEKLNRIILECKSKILHQVFNIYEENPNINKIWLYLDDIFNNKDVYNAKCNFYRLSGYKGETLEELEYDVKDDKGIVDISKIAKCYALYDNMLSKAIYNSFSYETNIEEIALDLNSKGLEIDSVNILSHIILNKPVAFNTFANGNDNKMIPYVVFINNNDMYSKEFNSTCIHEIMHYLGETNNEKMGLCFYKEINSIMLEEAYVDYVSKRIAKEYLKTHESIIEVRTNHTPEYLFDCVYDYFDSVYRLYGKELTKIHFSDEITLEEANNLVPIKQIIASIKRIKEAPKNMIKKISNEEVNKLNRSKR